MAATKLWLAQQLINGRGTGSISPSYVGSVSGGMSGSLSMRYGTATSDSYNGWVQVKMDMADSSISCIANTPITEGQRVAVLTTSSGQLKAIPIGSNIADAAIETVDVEYASGTSSSTAPESGWSTESPDWEQGRYIWQRTKTVTQSGATSYSEPVCIQGAQGEAAIGVSSTSVTYAVSSSGTTAPSSGWSGEVPDALPGQYLWSRTVTYYTDGTESVSYGVSYQGSNGQNGADGAPGADGHDGVGIASSDVSWQASNSGTTVPSGKWSQSVPDLDPGQYLWTRTVWTYTDGDSTTTYSVSRFGENGAQGIQGPPGEDGQPLYTWIKYADTPTSGMSDRPDGKTYMGIAYNKESSTESSIYSDYQWSLIKGADGAQGVQGPPGEDGTTLYTWIKYATSDAGANMSDNPTGRDYIGIAYNKTTATESTNPKDYAWSLIQGETGIGVKDVREQYYLSTSKTSQAGGSWTTTCPEWKKDHYIWTRSQITWTDRTVTYTPPVLASALNQANEKADVSTWYTFADEEGTHVVSTPNDATTGPNVLLNGYNLIFRDGTEELASFSPEEFEMLSFFIHSFNGSVSIGGNNLVIGSKPPTTSGWDMESVGVKELVQRCAAMHVEVFGDIASTATNTWAEGVFYTGNNNVVTFNTGTVMSVRSEDSAVDPRSIYIQQTGVYKVSLYGAVYSCSAGDLCHFGLGTDADNILVDAQQNMNGNWGTIAKTALMRVTEPDIYLKPFYKCEQGYGSKLASDTSSVTIEYLGVG